MSMEDEVREASRRFYSALSRMAAGDAGAMRECWSREAQVTAMHPIGQRDEGWEAVQGSFAQVAGLATGGEVHIEEALVRVVGDLAYEVGVERGRLSLRGHDLLPDVRVTNIYRREPGGWKMVHHHTDRSPEMLAVLGRIQSGS